jgi:hypothetical protein
MSPRGEDDRAMTVDGQAVLSDCFEEVNASAV